MSGYKIDKTNLCNNNNNIWMNKYNKYYKKNNNLIIEIPLKQDRWNPYSEKKIGEMDNFTGFMKATGEMGFAHLIDMSYKGKDSQWTDIMYYYDGSEREFRQLCKDLKINIIEE